MKILQTGSIFKICNDNIQTYDQLEPSLYTIQYSQKEEFYLQKQQFFTIKENIYGTHLSKASKVIDRFTKANRNLGVLLSGEKGTGKSLFAQLVCIKAKEKLNIPVILANTYFPGIADFINSIEQKAVIFFDEFDKTFYDTKNPLDSPQTEMLGLFDGTSTNPKLFIATCNEVKTLNNYLLNRPGRFHYHLSFNFPDSQEIRSYLEGELKSNKEIDNIINFTQKVPLSYDSLRAIVFELNLGSSFKETLSYLNILNLSTFYYSMCATLSNGKKLYSQPIRMNLFSTEIRSVDFFENNNFNMEEIGEISFTPNDAFYDKDSDNFIIDKNIDFSINNYHDNRDIIRKKYKDITVKQIILDSGKSVELLHYCV